MAIWGKSNSYEHRLFWFFYYYFLKFWEIGYLVSRNEALFSKRYKRKRAGQKGIGRFALQRLGEKLTITTQTLNEDLSNKIHTVTKRKEEGKTLKIERLKDKWSVAAIK